MGDVLSRFEDKFLPEPNSGCWIWEAGARKTPSKSYMQPWFRWPGESMPGARASWKLYRGEIPQGSHVLHICHNPLCVNPDHLYLGTHEDNMRDLKRSGRGRGGKGATPEDTVRGIKNAQDGASALSVAKKFNVNAETVRRIWSGERWSHIHA